MIYELKDNAIYPSSLDAESYLPGEEGKYIGIFKLNGEKTVCLKDTIPPNVLHCALSNKMSRFESHDGTDVFCINMINVSSFSDAPAKIYIFLQCRFMQFVTDAPSLVRERIEDISKDGVTFASLLYSFFEGLFTEDLERLEKLENGIAKLENEILEAKLNKRYSKKIISLRKHLRTVKQYYEQLIDILEYIDANKNQLYEERELKYFRILSGRVNRLYSKVLNLLDYVTEVREAYQSEVDISLNSTMQLLTVITIIFLPLTLIAGWYGMNLQMPEYRCPYSYPAVTAVCVLIALGAIYYFKKKKWF